MLKPQAKVPDLTVKTVGGPDWKLSEQSPENFTFVFFYRGYHCPICRKYLGSIDRKLGALSRIISASIRKEMFPGPVTISSN